MKCRSCPHDAHFGICTVSTPSNANRCGCSVVTLSPDVEFAAEFMRACNELQAFIHRVHELTGKAPTVEVKLPASTFATLMRGTGLHPPGDRVTLSFGATIVCEPTTCAICKGAIRAGDQVGMVLDRIAGTSIFGHFACVLPEPPRRATKGCPVASHHETCDCDGRAGDR